MIFILAILVAVVVFLDIDLLSWFGLDRDNGVDWFLFGMIIGFIGILFKYFLIKLIKNTEINN